jgi:hypothetical protein
MDVLFIPERTTSLLEPLDVPIIKTFINYTKKNFLEL